ncbi:ABC transporter ATP-binding protein [Stappia indica]|uniref:ATP-binding cassette domain-containing protein n=1 Tax=Stappia indica TaxID=538381 RepID=A0A857C6G7_9HYPH|nr:ABC transporter ATP-binding protein [Stappia indica]QGZ34497.1 ATP-binding cassette domain-containing protein [Stappia indica]
MTRPNTDASDLLLDMRGLTLGVATPDGILPVVQDLSLSLSTGETLGIVGESGCGKSLTSLAIMGLLEGTPVRVLAGEIFFRGRDLLRLSPRERRAVMGNEMSMIFQEPMTSLNPVYRIGDQIIEAIREHQPMSRRAARDRALELLTMVRIPDPAGRIDSFPHQLSGGQRQRVMIAMALAGSPRLLIADEPTTALDVTVQAQILNLIVELQKETGMGVMLISHDLGVIAETCDRIAVMYRGRVVETAGARELFQDMRHPYTRGLLDSIPEADEDVDRLSAIPGRVPTLDEAIAGCAFHPRCARAGAGCDSDQPALTAFAPTHFARCHYPLEPDA